MNEAEGVLEAEWRMNLSFLIDRSISTLNAVPRIRKRSKECVEFWLAVAKQLHAVWQFWLFAISSPLNNLKVFESFSYESAEVARTRLLQADTKLNASSIGSVNTFRRFHENDQEIAIIINWLIQQYNAIDEAWSISFRKRGPPAGSRMNCCPGALLWYQEWKNTISDAIPSRQMPEKAFGCSFAVSAVIDGWPLQTNRICHTQRVRSKKELIPLIESIVSALHRS